MSQPRATPHRSRGYWLRICLFAGATLSLGFGLLLAGLGRSMALGYLRPQRQDLSRIGTPADLGVPYQDVTLTTSDGIALAAWYTASANDTVVLVAHGHAAARLPEIYALFATNGYGVLAWDARAHGASGGDFTSLGYFERLDAAAALAYAQAQPGVRHVVMWGQSMGGATAILAAAEQPAIEAVIVDSVFTTLAETINTAVPIPVLRPFIRPFAEAEAGISVDRVRPIDEISRIAPRPIFIIHGADDTAVPPDSGPRLYAAAGEPKALWIIAGARHVGGYRLDPATYETRVIAFLADAVAP